MKVADLSGELGSRRLALLSAIVCGCLLGILITESSFSSAIILGVILGVALTGKINQLNLIIGAAVTFLTALLLGFVMPSIWLLAIVAFFAFIDEVLHDQFAGKSVPLAKFFSYRCCLKSFMLIVAILALVPPIYPIGFLTFDLTYDFSQVLFSRLGVMPWLKKLGG